MGDLLIQDNGKIRKASDVEFAESIIDKKNTKDKWEVIDDLVKKWAEFAPDDVEAMKININQYRETQTDKKFAQTLKGKDMERRFILSFPRTLMFMIRAIYKSDELPMDSKFYTEFGKRYPFFKVANKV